MSTFLLLVALCAPAVGAASIVALRPTGLRPGRFVVTACAAASISSIALLVWSAAVSGGVVGVGDVIDLNRTSAILLAVVTSIALVVASFARRNVDVDPRSPRFFILFGLLASGSAVITVPTGPWPLIVGWFVSSWSFVGLVGHDIVTPSARRAQRRTGRAMIVGDVAFVAAIAVLVIAAGQDATRDVGASLDTLRDSSVLGAGAIDVVAVLLVIAGAARSSQIPLHRWLVTTLAAPTPVSALVHAGFVSGAGLLLVRFAPLVVESSFALHLAFAIGVATTVVAVGAGARRVDVKGRLAWSTVSQMGFMVIQCSVGAFSSAVFHICGHAMYKAAMFLGAGDAVAASLRSKRRPAPIDPPASSVRAATAAIAATAAVAVGMVVLPPEVSDAGVVLVAVFAWLTIANGVWGFMGRGAVPPMTSIPVAAVGAFAAAFAYLGGLRAIERFVEPALAAVPKNAGVDAATLVVVLAIVAAGAGALALVDPARDRVDIWLERVAHPGLSDRDAAVTPFQAAAQRPPAISDPADLSRLRADVARARAIVAPLWPLTSFVAVNPLGGLEESGFEEASRIARRQLRARTHLSLRRYRADHAAGVTDSDDLRWAIATMRPELDGVASVIIDGREVTPSTIIEMDLLDGIDVVETHEPQTALERIEGVDGAIGVLIDASISHSLAHHLTTTGSSTSSMSFSQRWRRDATSISALRLHFAPHAIEWIDALGNDPAEAIDAAFDVTGIDPSGRVGEMRGHLGRLNGWAGLARWRTEWAHGGEDTPALAPIEIVAARAALEAAWTLGRDVATAPAAAAPAVDIDGARVEAVLSALGTETSNTAVVDQVRGIIAAIAPDERAAVWLVAQERRVDRDTLALLDRPEPHEADPPAAQLVFCIDVRSEGLRRHLEATGPYDTLGFAGFFGVPMAVRRLAWTHPEPRCPVLVAPSVGAVERPRIDEAGQQSDVSGIIARGRRLAAAKAVHSQTKTGIGAAFVMAEAAGWLAGPVAAVRTLVGRVSTPVVEAPTTMEFDRLADAVADIEQRVDIGEAVLTTMGLTSGFAPLVVLSGHTSDNVNNPHGTALDCGACAGASGQDNARAVAALLNEPGVRDGLRDRGIDIPAGTHFVPAIHDTVSDRVDLLDLADVGDVHRAGIDRLRRDLAVAAQRNAAQRADHLPGPARGVRRRGTDWAQVRPEWGLARNAAFVIAPRSATAGLDLGGRSFLHSYDPETDPEGNVLETIMTAPLVVGHWISSQYYFSTVDPERFGAGDKLMHNVVGDIGVISGEHGDLRVGFPTQSTHLGDRHHHQPVRLLAVIQAPLDRIDRIVRQNPILTTLTRGSWIRIAARSHPNEPWSARAADGTWTTEPHLTDTTLTLEHS